MFAFGLGRTVNISAAELQQRLEAGEKPVMIDVREPWEYAEGHIPGSVLKPLGQIRTWANEYPKEKELILVCRSSSRSAQAYQFLKSLGFTNLKNMSGGIITWRGKVAR